MAALAAHGGVLVYSTGFEAGGGLSFAPGSLHGQNGWLVTDGAAGSYDGSVYCLDAAGNRLFYVTDTDVHALDHSTRAAVWTKTHGYPHAPILAGTTLVAGPITN